MLAGLHHKPDSAIIAEYLAYSGTGATPEALEPFGHWNMVNAEVSQVRQPL